MITYVRILGALLVVAMATAVASPPPARAADADSINRDAGAALDALFEKTPQARQLAANAKAVLVFPNIVKAGFIAGAQYGDGVLLVKGAPVAYYNIVAASYGFQAGVQAFGYAMFLMTDSAREYLDRSSGWEVGMGPSIVVVDTGMGRSMTTTTMKDDVYAFIFDQKGLMGGGGLQGSKITRLNR